MYDIPRSMTWCKDCICVGFKRDYFTVKVSNSIFVLCLPRSGKIRRV